jgi:hypothetical protein
MKKLLLAALLAVFAAGADAQITPQLSQLCAQAVGSTYCQPTQVPASSTWQYSTAGTAITTNTSATLQAAQAANVRNYLASFSCDNSGSGAATELQILDGSTVIYDGFIGAASATLNVPHLAVSFPIPLRGSAATAMSLKVVTTSASLWCSAQGYAAN